MPHNKEKEFSEGTIFVKSDPPYMYLYRMLADLGTHDISDPDAPLIQTPAYNVFVKSLPGFYHLFHRKPVEKPVYDTILHCLAYLYAKKHPDFVDAASINAAFAVLHQEVKKAATPIKLWTPCRN
jgi:hypothetical protein